ncbi:MULTISPECIES: CPXCG motif-containing cysteine-rich protein [Salinivibrio]|jgi:transcription elongation factor Elf1|uniref:CPXCG motif-containing cysteine-rich protein n=1 Tax=Salinivibrio proteolyticus TaxID=334715 RepID=A0ABY7LHT7_9GAMM|nr:MULTISPECIES: CPXCG motif-containing cysteine-rich protein [Salinivibrio]ODQ00728.1 molybdopterin-guanine dinucleotide biosynthesis protein A [Salinivibrio sp. DV]OOF10067.1 molybdopterin-guanine dinucleotide biosynthesis protein A [Salinivibrio sp. PR5]OOF12695.1 molybdopterin-guanine dinucleotide biosynthesis protein A [Salinivibrio sp. PR919]OOF18090.1 molybdopterin-guanine dinucleotide biosynthesis protein A [Salinivibrio sp. PR932]OOF22102.1 molybdopterin-guanine dinucleotide biosynthe
MKDITDRIVSCPHCGHRFDITLDLSGGNQEFYEDCPNCCNAIHYNMQIDELHKTVNLFVDADDEQIF